MTCSNLPTELWHIFLFLTAPIGQDIDDFDAPWWSLRLVCLQWKDVANMLIYSHLTVLPECMDFTERGSRLQHRWQQMDKKPHRWKYARSLFWSVESDYEWDNCVLLTKESNSKGQCFPSTGLKTPGLRALLWPRTIADNCWAPTKVSRPEWCQLWNQLENSLEVFQFAYTTAHSPMAIHMEWSFGEIVEIQGLHSMLGVLRRGTCYWVSGTWTSSSWKVWAVTSCWSPSEPWLLESLVLPMRAVESDTANLLFLWPAHLKRVTIPYIHDTINSQNDFAPMIQKLLNLHSDSLEQPQSWDSEAIHHYPEVWTARNHSETDIPPICPPITSQMVVFW